jgi:hypothetical protein
MGLELPDAESSRRKTEADVKDAKARKMMALKTFIAEAG